MKDHDLLMLSFHSILLERSLFLQLGWNIVYGFNESDYEVWASADTKGMQLDSDSHWNICHQMDDH